MWQAAVGGVAGVLLAGLSTQVVKHIACRARPRLVDGWGVGTATPPDAPARRGFFHWPCFGERDYHGFPSGHAATAFATAAALVGWAPGRRRGLDPRRGVRRWRLADRAQRALPLGRPRRRALRLVGRRGGRSSWCPAISPPLARAHAGTAFRGAGRPRDAALPGRPSRRARRRAARRARARRTCVRSASVRRWPSPPGSCRCSRARAWSMRRATSRASASIGSSSSRPIAERHASLARLRRPRVLARGRGRGLSGEPRPARPPDGGRAGRTAAGAATVT